MSLSKNDLALACLLFAITVGCGQDRAQDLLETAQLEERQHNVSHARELYEELLRRYPESREAATARERLAVLSDRR